MFPVFRKDANGGVSVTDTKSATAVKAEKRKWAKPVQYSEDKVSACRQCREAGGDESEPKQWMGFLRIQWGSFRGETYRWLLENTPGYCGWLVNQIESETLSSSDNLFLHKKTFVKYVSMFPEGKELVALKAKIKKPADNSASKKHETTTLVEDQSGEMDSAADKELVVCLEKYEDAIKGHVY